MNFNHRDSESITDICTDDDLPEVELVSMLEEQLPQYKLRVDSLYLSENEDWTPSPSHRGHLPEITSPVLAEETFRYMKEQYQRWSGVICRGFLVYMNQMGF
ncbi:UNVERIFIED_CONTAM: Trafficking kinesin-binding protein 2 [Gekko kuhli]